MGFVRVQTSQNVPIEFQVAGIGDRILARLIDILIWIVYIFAVSFIVQYLVRYGEFPDWFWILLSLPLIFYDVVSETLMHGQTIGKKVLGIRVVKLDGSQPGLGSYIMRWLAGMLEVYPIAGTIGIVAIAANGQGQRLGDLAAGTAVVRIFRKDRIANSVFRQLDEAYQPTFPQVAQLTDRDMTIVDEAFRKAVRFKNTRLMRHLTKHLTDVMGLDPEADERLKNLTARDFLRIVVRDYNYYTGKL